MSTFRELYITMESLRKLNITIDRALIADPATTTH